MIQRALLLLLFVLSSFLGQAQNPIQVATRQFANNPNLKGAKISIAVLDLVNNDLIAEYEAKTTLIPASSLKVITTASALAALGKDYRYKTQLAYTGTIQPGGILNGDLVIVGFGDPSLGSPEWDQVPDMEQLMKAWVEVIKSAGIRQINGHVITDASYFSGDEPIPSSWEDSDVGNYYGAGVWALNIHENLFYLPFQQKRQGQTPGIAPLKPKVEGLKFSNQIRSAGPRSGDNAYIYGGPYDYQREIKGSIPSGSGIFTIKGSLPDAPLLAAQAMHACLLEEGVGVVKTPKVVWNAITSTTLLNQHQSPSLAEIVDRTNKESVNLYCEAMLKTVGKVKQNQGTRAFGIKAIREIWTARGLDMGAFKMIDGSGLSKENKVSAYTLAAVLRKSLKDPLFGEDMHNSLPVAGISGTLEKRMKGTYAENRLSAKTGSLGGVRSYTGYVKNRSGQQLVFSIIVNDYKCSGSVLRQQMEKWLVALASS